MSETGTRPHKTVTVQVQVEGLREELEKMNAKAMEARAHRDMDWLAIAEALAEIDEGLKMARGGARACAAELCIGEEAEEAMRKACDRAERGAIRAQDARAELGELLAVPRWATGQAAARQALFAWRAAGRAALGDGAGLRGVTGMIDRQIIKAFQRAAINIQTETQNAMDAAREAHRMAAEAIYGAQKDGKKLTPVEAAMISDTCDVIDGLREAMRGLFYARDKCGDVERRAKNTEETMLRTAYYDMLKKAVTKSGFEQGADSVRVWWEISNPEDAEKVRRTYDAWQAAMQADGEDIHKSTGEGVDK